MLSHYFYYRVFLALALFDSSYPLNPTQNHLVHSTLPIFNLSTQPLLLPGSKHPETKKSESRKRTPNSRKCLVFKPFSVFTSVLLTSTLHTRRVMCAGTYRSGGPFQYYIRRFRAEILHRAQAFRGYRKHIRCA